MTDYCNCYDPWNCQEPLVDRPCRPWSKRERENAERADRIQAENIQLQNELERLKLENVKLRRDRRTLHADLEFWKGGHHAANEEIQRCITALSELMYVGNRLARGEATADEWHEAVSRVIPENVKPIVCKRENEDDLSGT